MAQPQHQDNPILFLAEFQERIAQKAQLGSVARRARVPSSAF
jgi:hypothetical protein